MGVSDAPAAANDGVDGETARLRSSWVELGRMGSEGGTGGERGVFRGVGGVVGDAAGVHDAGSGVMARSRGVWGG
jgi:hypothetical protein